MPLPPIIPFSQVETIINTLKRGEPIPPSKSFFNLPKLGLIRNCIEVWNKLEINSWKDSERSELELFENSIGSLKFKHHAVKGAMWSGDAPAIWLPGYGQLTKHYSTAATIRNSIAAASFLEGDEKRDVMQIIGAAYCVLTPGLFTAMQTLVAKADEDGVEEAIRFFNYFRNSLILALDFAEPAIRKRMDDTGRNRADDAEAHINMTNSKLYPIFHNYFVSGNLYLEANDWSDGMEPDLVDLQ